MKDGERKWETYAPVAGDGFKRPTALVKHENRFLIFGDGILVIAKLTPESTRKQPLANADADVEGVWPRCRGTIRRSRISACMRVTIAKAGVRVVGEVISLFSARKPLAARAAQTKKSRIDVPHIHRACPHLYHSLIARTTG